MAKPRSTRRRTVVIGLLGTTLDVGKGPRRWGRWRPTVSLCQQEELIVDRLELLHTPRAKSFCRQISADIEQVSPETEVIPHVLALDDPWDFEEVYAALHAFAEGYPFDLEKEDYLVHITTGTHVVQICLFLLTETRFFPARLIQTSPAKPASKGIGTYSLIDLDLSKYDRLAARFEREAETAIDSLKGGIQTRNPSFNRLIERIERVALATRDPILLTGPTGAGKTRLAHRIHHLRHARRLVEGALVEVNCATLRGDVAMSTLFGHEKGAFTGAAAKRAGLLRAADGGVLFLDEIGELGLDEQAMLLRALEEKRFLPMGADREVSSDFQLIAGTNRDLRRRVEEGLFREDLLARIDLWTFALPALRERPEDIAPNLDHELERISEKEGRRTRFAREARDRFLDFATSSEGRWSGNFRDLSAAVVRMATLAPGGRIDLATVEEEIERLTEAWRSHGGSTETARSSPGRAEDALEQVLGADALAAIDPFDRPQLAETIRVCRTARTLSDAGRQLFAVSRAKKSSSNDADRLRKYLARFGLSFKELR